MARFFFDRLSLDFYREYNKEMPNLIKCQLANEGYGDWEQPSLLLKEHETGVEHIFHMITWKDVRLTLEKNQDKINQEKQHWRNVLPRIISVVKFLVKHLFTFF